MDAAAVLLKIILVQIGIAIIIVFVLKKMLDNILVESALKRLDVLRLGEGADSPDEVTVITHKTIKTVNLRAIQRLVRRKWGPSVGIKECIDKRLKGGIVIKAESFCIDCSLMGRLKEGGIVR